MTPSSDLQVTGTPPEAPSYVVVGHLTKPHGTKGEFHLWPLTDHPDVTFTVGARFFVSDPQGRDPDPALGALVLSEVRRYRQGFLVAFRDVYGREGAEPFRGRYLLRLMSEVPPRAEDELFYHELLQMEVFTVAGDRVGSVKEVYPAKPNDLLEVDRGEGTILIPFNETVVVGWDLGLRRITVDPPEGLLDL
jgi:16S rRNA processing protein RimM